MDTVVYVHGRGGSAAECEHYASLFPGRKVTGLAYQGDTPWEAGKELRAAIMTLAAEYRSVTLIANSIGAFFCMHAGIETTIDRAYFISPVLDMERLIFGIMARCDVSEEELREKGRIITTSGEDLSWEFLRYVRQHPLHWNAPTEILYGSRDTLTSYETVASFARSHGAGLTVMEGGEHWFHTEEQMRFLDHWITEKERKKHGF